MVQNWPHITNKFFEEDGLGIKMSQTRPSNSKNWWTYSIFKKNWALSIFATFLHWYAPTQKLDILWFPRSSLKRTLSLHSQGNLQQVGIWVWGASQHAGKVIRGAVHEKFKIQIFPKNTLNQDFFLLICWFADLFPSHFRCLRSHPALSPLGARNMMPNKSPGGALFGAGLY